MNRTVMTNQEDLTANTAATERLQQEISDNESKAKTARWETGNRFERLDKVVRDESDELWKKLESLLASSPTEEMSH